MVARGNRFCEHLQMHQEREHFMHDDSFGQHEVVLKAAMAHKRTAEKIAQDFFMWTASKKCL
jgi:hypothetical protein